MNSLSHHNQATAGQEMKLDAQLVQMIADGSWKVGERLPAERKLSVELGVSRNTLRHVLKRLETRGMVSIRKGSGCYLTAREPHARKTELMDDDSVINLMSRLEAAYLFLPELVGLAALRIDSLEVKNLEEIISKLGAAIVERDMDQIKVQTKKFFYKIATATDNPVVDEVVRSLCVTASVVFPRFLSFPEDERAKMFGDFVRIFRALKDKDAERARCVTRRKIVNTAVAFSKLRNVPLSHVIANAVQEEARC
jgi:GntR family transcriptional regulator, transcriptional repressor for pyruvate dehydrogenase complex